jgi:zinc/manganese transport system substrate-binding protein
LNKKLKPRASSLRHIASAFSAALILVLGLTTLIVSHKGRSVTAVGGLQVVAAENFWGDIAQQIGGNYVHVNSIISDPTADPHLYESNAVNASEVSSADIVIVNGVGYDDFIQKLLDSGKNDKRQVISAANIYGMTDNQANPHLWYNLPRVHQVASAIAQSYEQKDPVHKIKYQQNLTNFLSAIKPILDEMAYIKKTFLGAPVAYTEPVPLYLLNAIGLIVKTPKGFAKSVQESSDPSPSDALAMEHLMTSKAIKILLYNSQVTSPVTKHIRDLAKRFGIPVIGVSETLPYKAKNYQSWQKGQLDQILKVLKSGSQ